MDGNLKIAMVTSLQDRDSMRYCRFFVQNLGASFTKLSSTSDEKKKWGDGRIINGDDMFVYNYRQYYKRYLYAYGNIEFVKVYYDTHLNKGEIRLYINQEEYIHNIKYELNHKNINNTIAKIITDSKDKYFNGISGHDQEKIDKFNKRIDQIESEIDMEGDANKLFTNPGKVNAKDIYEYLKLRNRLDENDHTKKFKI